MFGGPRMILHAYWKNTFPKWRFGFLLPSETPPPPGLVKDHTFYGFFSGNLPSPLKLDSIQKLKVSKKSFSNWWSYQQENLSLLSSIDVTKFKALLLRSKKACQVRSFNKTKPHFQKVKTTSCTYQHCKHHREFSIHHTSKDMSQINNGISRKSFSSQTFVWGKFTIW